MSTQKDAASQALFDAVTTNKTDEALALIKPGVSANLKNKRGWTMLHSATSHGNVAVMKALIAHGANLEAKDEDEWTPLTGAAENNNLASVRVLLDSQANINAQSFNKYTPLIMAVDRGHADVVRELLQRGADVNLTDDSGWTPLFHASFYGRLDIMRLVLDAGVNLGAVNNEKETALQMLAFNRNAKAQAVALLFEYSTPEQIENALDLAIDNSDGGEVSTFAIRYRAQQRLDAVVSETVASTESESIKQPARMRL